MNHLFRPTSTRASLLLVLAMTAAVLIAPSATAERGGPIRFAEARDYPSANITYNGTANPGAVTHLYRNGRTDRYPDLVLANIVGGPVVLYGTGGGEFGGRRVLNNSDTDASAVAVADFNRDGITDIVSGGYTTERLTVMLGRRDGSFRVSGKYLLRGVWPSQFQITDLNRDGHLDIATTAYAGGRITILLGNGDGTFRQAPPVRGTNLALAMVAADFNGDAIPDLAVTESIPVLGNLTLHGSVKILLGNGDATFRVLATHPIGVLSELVRYADVNEDGKRDLVILNALVGNDASILLGLGGGRFAPERRMHVGGPDSIQIGSVRTLDGGEGMRLADFNNDGHLDMAITQMISSTLVIFKGDGHGRFTFVRQQRVTGFPEDLMAADLDGDGCVDLAVPGNVPPVGAKDPGVARVSIVLNRSAGCRPRPVAATAPSAHDAPESSADPHPPSLQAGIVQVARLALLPWSGTASGRGQVGQPAR